MVVMVVSCEVNNSSISPIRNYKDGSFYLKSAISGGIAACFTHVIMVPIDVVKTRMQLSAKTYASTSVAFKTIWQREGFKGLTTGFGPTTYGYLTQGMFKYGLYELFKTQYTKALGQERAEKYRNLLYLTAGMTAEAIADVFLTPFEAVRIRLVADPSYANGTTIGAMKRITSMEGLKGLYKGFIPLVMKQVPYTAVKLMVFEATEELLYDHILTTPRIEQNNITQLGVTTLSGFVGGVASAIVSHPADTVLTKVNATEGGASLITAVRQAGFFGIWAGLVPRMGMVGALAALQLLVYDATKVTIFGLPTSQGIKKVYE